TWVGGAGSDRFEFFFAPSDPVTIADLDALFLAEQIIFHPTTFISAANIDDFVKTATVNGSTVLQLDVDGTGGATGFVDAALLQGTTRVLNAWSPKRVLSHAAGN